MSIEGGFVLNSAFVEKRCFCFDLLNFKKCTFCCLFSLPLSTLQSPLRTKKGLGVGAASGLLFVSSPEFPNPCPVLYLLLCAGHQLPKPHVILQLEKGEEPWLVERGIHQETQAGEHQSRDIPGSVPDELLGAGIPGHSGH